MFLLELMRSGMEALLTPFDWLGAFWGLTFLSLITGIAMLWVVGKSTPQALVERCRAKMDSAIYEIRLFIDSPVRVLMSLGRLVSNSLLYILAMMPAFVILALPLGLMFLSLEARHGLAALPLGQPLVVTVELGDEVNGRDLVATHSEGLEITAPPMYVESEHKVYIRTEAKTPRTHALFVSLGSESPVEKLLVADPEATQMAPDRSSGSDLLFAYGPEASLDSDVITGVHVSHPTRDGRYLGIDMPWWVWWLLLMMISAFGLRKRLGVAL